SVLTESYEGASPEIRLHKSFGNVTVVLQEDIMVSPPPQEKSLNPGSTGHISSATHVGNRLHGTFPLIKWKQIHPSSYRLRNKVVRGSSLPPLMMLGM
nr:hypothetical protein [Tanacetum cinerariifolium]